MAMKLYIHPLRPSMTDSNSEIAKDFRKCVELGKKSKFINEHAGINTPNLIVSVSDQTEHVIMAVYGDIVVLYAPTSISIVKKLIALDSSDFVDKKVLVYDIDLYRDLIHEVGFPKEALTWE